MVAARALPGSLPCRQGHGCTSPARHLHCSQNHTGPAPPLPTLHGRGFLWDDRVTAGGLGDCGWPRPPVSPNFLHSRPRSPRWLMVQSTALHWSRRTSPASSLSAAHGAHRAYLAAAHPSADVCPRARVSCPFRPESRPLTCKFGLKFPASLEYSCGPQSPPWGRAQLFRCCLPVSREQTGAPPPRDHLSLSAWDWKGSQDVGHRALSPQRPPRSF